MPESPHEVLGVKPGASRQEVKDAFYRQAKRWHPDLNASESARAQFDKLQWATQQLLEGKATARTARAQQSAGAEAFQRAPFSFSRPGVPATLGYCAAAVAFSLVVFAFKFHQHEDLYPRKPKHM